METLLVLTYAAICIVVFKVFKIPLTKWTVPTAILGGVVLIGGSVIWMNYNHPYTEIAQTVVVTTPIIPLVRGRVIEVPVKPNTPLKKGEVLFKIDPTAYQAEVNRTRAQLGYQRLRLQQYQKLAAGAAGTRFQVQETEARVRHLEAELDRVKFDLEQTVIRAPTDGFVTQMLLRPGMIAVPIPLRPTMVFAHKSRYRLIGSFVQNSLERVKPGNEAEVVFLSIPGHVFKAKVDFIQPVLAQGEVQSGGRLIQLENVSTGRVPVHIVLDEDITDLHLPVGVAATVAIYNDDSFVVHHLAIIRRMLLRMSSWKNYVFGPIH